MLKPGTRRNSRHFSPACSAINARSSKFRIGSPSASSARFGTESYRQTLVFIEIRTVVTIHGVAVRILTDRKPLADQAGLAPGPLPHSGQRSGVARRS